MTDPEDAKVAAEAIRNFLVSTKMSGNRLALGATMMTWERDDDQGHLHEVFIRTGAGGNRKGPLKPGGLYRAREAWLDLGADGETIELHVRDHTERGLRPDDG